MKQASIIIQLVIGAILIISWSDYQSIVEHKTAFSSITAFHSSLENSMSYLNDGINRYIEGAVAATERSPSQKIFVDKSGKANALFQVLYTELENYENEFCKWEENQNSYEQQSKFPLDYHSKEPVQNIFIEQNKAKVFSELLQNTLNKLEELVKLEEEYPRLTKAEIKAYYTNQDRILSNRTTLINLVLDAELFEKLIKDYDVVHAKSLLEAIEYDMMTMEMELIKNIIGLIRKDEEPKSDYIMVMNYDKKPIVGQPFTARFWQRAYSYNTNFLTMKMNGKEVKQKDGFGIFSFTPKTTEPVHLKLEIALQNPFTGKVDRFRRTIKKEVAN